MNPIVLFVFFSIKSKKEKKTSIQQNMQLFNGIHVSV